MARKVILARYGGLPGSAFYWELIRHSSSQSQGERKRLMWRRCILTRSAGRGRGRRGV